MFTTDDDSRLTISPSRGSTDGRVDIRTIGHSDGHSDTRTIGHSDQTSLTDRPDLPDRPT